MRVDNTAPTGVAVTSPLPAANVHATITVDATATDTGSGVATVAFQRSPAGANTWTTFDTDSTGPSPYHGTLNTTDARRRWPL